MRVESTNCSHGTKFKIFDHFYPPDVPMGHVVSLSKQH